MSPRKNAPRTAAPAHPTHDDAARPFGGMARVLDCLDTLDKQRLNAPLVEPGPPSLTAEPFDPLKLRIRDWFWRRCA